MREVATSTTRIRSGRVDNRCSRPFLRRYSELMCVYISSGSMSGSMDVLLEQIEQRFADEIAANGVALIDYGER